MEGGRRREQKIGAERRCVGKEEKDEEVVGKRMKMKEECKEV